MNLDILTLKSNKADDRTQIESISSKDIAIIGIAGKWPLANNVEEYWENIKNGKDCIQNFPYSRKKDIEPFCEKNKEYFECGFLNEIDKFDYSFFHISPKDANLMDPHHRLFLESAYEAIEDAGYGGKKIIGTNTGVFVGMSDLGDIQYIDLINKSEPEFLVQALSSNTKAILPSRVSYTFDLHGPSMLIDTACSSSLVALSTACKSLRENECEMALVGGAKAYLLPLKERPMLGIESSDARTRAFDESSDGTGVGEGTMAVLLKPLHKALKDRDHIYGVIKGIAINQDGRSIGISAPNPVAQADVIEKAWKDARIDPTTINYIEAHGTGTKLGDPIEIDGLTKAFSKYTDLKSFCAISTVKSNIGHLYDLSGLSSLIKVIMEFKYKELAPSIHFNVPNQRIDFERSPVYVNDKLRKWEAVDSVRRCGISSFGFSGTNCHVVLEEAPKTVNSICPAKSTEVLAVSAKSQEVLIELLKSYLGYLEKDKTINFHDFCYTANTGRGQYECRVVFLPKDQAELIDLLKNCIKKQPLDDEQTKKLKKIFFGSYNLLSGKNVSKSGNYISNNEKLQFSEEANSKLKYYNTVKKEDISILQSVCDLYIKGGDVNWDELYRGEKRSRVSIPVYPLKRERCWLDMPNKKYNVGMSNINGLLEVENLPDEARKKIAMILKEYEINEKQDESIDEHLKVVLAGREDGMYTETEKILAKIWYKVLGANKINIFDDYLELGGDSISGAKIVNLVNSKMNKNIAITNLMENRSIIDFAQYIDSELSESSLPDILPIEEKQYFPVSSSQKRIFITSLMSKNVYNVPGVLILEGKIDFNKFKDTLKRVADRHEILRTTFDYKEKKIVQLVHEEAVISLEWHEVKENNIDEIIKSFIKPFDLKQLPLFRFHILKVDEQRHYLFYDFHHIITDGTSHGVFLNDFIHLYSNLPLPEITIQYKDYAFWQNKILNENHLKKQEKFWLKRFSKQNTLLQLHYDYTRPDIRSYKGKNSFFTINKDLKSRLKQFAYENNCTLFVPLLSAYSILLSKNSGQDKIVIGTPVAGRQNKKLENLVGVFINSVAIVTKPKAGYLLADFVKKINKEVLKVFKNQEYPFDILVEKLGWHNNPSRNPLFDTMFQYQNMVMPKMNCTEVKVDRYEIENEIALFDLTLEIIEHDSVLNCRFKYCRDLFKSETIDRWREEYLEILNYIVENKELKLEQLVSDKHDDSIGDLKLDCVEFNFD